MSFAVRYYRAVVEDDLPRLSSAVKQQIKLAIEQKLMTAPEIFGVPLRHSLRGYRKLRVGDYRIIFRLEESEVKIFIIQHRSRVYK